MMWRLRRTHDAAKRRGFTLLELLMVVIIIGILASLAIPNFLKVREKARMAEALSILGYIRGSEARHFAEFQAYTINPAALDFDPKGVTGQTFYTYTISAVDPKVDFTATASRAGAGFGCADPYEIRMNQNGSVCGTNCQSAGCVPTP